MLVFAVIYSGESVAGARAIAVSARPDTVSHIARAMLADASETPPDALTAPILESRRQALERIANSAAPIASLPSAASRHRN